MKDMETIVAALPRIREAARGMQEIVLANLVAIGEVAAPRGQEAARVRMFLERGAECGLQSASADGAGNGLALLPGREGRSNILLFSNVDTLAETPAEPSLVFRADEIVGPFLGDNSLALAVMVSLPILLDRLDLRLNANVVVLGAVRMLGRGNLEGLTSFLASDSLPIRYGLSLESVQLGRLNYACLGLLLCELKVRLPDDYNWVQFGATGSIIVMNDVISRINAIPLPRRPLTSIVFGMIRGGVSSRNIARETTLRFEVRSESAELLDKVSGQIEDIAEDVAANSGVDIRFDVFARRAPGGLDIAHPLVRQARRVQAALDIPSQLYPTTFALTSLLERNIPALVLGLTTGKRQGALAEMEEAVALDPLWTGLAQVVGLLLALDGGCCDVA